MLEPFWFVLVLLFASFCHISCMQDSLHSEDDNIISEAMNTRKQSGPEIKRNAVPYNNQYYGSLHLPSANTMAETKKRSNADPASIAGDVNKYGLWEYTADNTGMGDQINQLINNVQNKDLYDATSSHALEKQAMKMNEQINRYAENESGMPTIDPMESPGGYKPTGKQRSLNSPEKQPVIDYSNGYAPTEKIAALTGPDSSPISHSSSSNGENVDVITIPNTMSIEDEQGNHLDMVKAEPIKSFANQLKQTKATAKSAEKEGSLFFHKHEPTQNQINVKDAQPTNGLTLKLLQALKRSESFRNFAEKILPLSSDTKEELAQKQKNIGKFIKAYKTIDENNNHDLTTKIKIFRYRPRKNNLISAESNGKLLNIVKNLIKSNHENDEGHERNQLHDLLSALRSNEKDAAKMEGEFHDSSPGTSTGETSLSDPYLKHFKEFVEKHKHPESTSKMEADKPLGSDVSSPLLGYLEQESDDLNHIKDTTQDPKVELDRLESMLIKQKKEQNNIQKQHDKIMLGQFKKLLKEGVKSKEENQKIASHNGDDRTELPSNPDDGTTSNDEFYNELKSSKAFQDFAASMRSSEKQGDDHEDSITIDSGGKESFEEQLKDIAAQKEVLKYKEAKLKHLAEQIGIQSVMKDSERYDADRLVQNTSDENDKTMNYNKEMSSNNEDATQSAKDESEKHDKNKNKEKETKWYEKQEKGRKNHESETEKEKEKKKYGNDEDLKKNESDQATSDVDGKNETSSKKNVTSTEQSSIHDLKSEEQFKLVDVHKEKLHSLSDTESSERDGASLLIKAGQQSDHKDSNITLKVSDDESIHIQLPINNPAPHDDNHIAPHTNFHEYKHFDGTDEMIVHARPSQAPSNVISPIHSPFYSKKKHHKAPSLKDIEGIDTLPPAGMGKPNVLGTSDNGISIQHHVYPIVEPSSARYQGYTNALGEKPNSPSNLLKHKSIPKTETTIELTGTILTPPLHESPYARIIKPHSSHSKLIDITATKKGFGKKPKKPKALLLKELREKLKAFAMKRHLMKQLIAKSRTVTSLLRNNTELLKKIARNMKQHNASKRSQPLTHDHVRHNNSVLVPAPITNRIVTVLHNTTNQSNSNVIVPGSFSSKLLSDINDQNGERINPVDITRSVLPNQPVQSPSMEDVFNLLGSEDHVTTGGVISKKSK